MLIWLRGLGWRRCLGANLAGLERWGYVVVRPASPAGTDVPSGRKVLAGRKTHQLAEWVVRPTRAGRYAQAIWGRLEAAIERRWEQRFGADLVAELRACLTAAIGDAHGAGHRALPLYLPVVGYADGMRTAFEGPTDEQLAAAGVTAGEPAGLGLSALLARALLLVTLGYERRSRLSLPICADILPAIGALETPMRVLPLRAGVSREGVSAAAKFLQRIGYATIGPDQAARRGQAIALTERGVAELDAHERRIRAIEEGWVERRGVAEVGRLRDCALAFAGCRADGEPDRPALSLGLEPYPDGWRSRPPYKTQTEAFVADPWTALPRHPMVLHRGGFPDGS